MLTCYYTHLPPYLIPYLRTSFGRRVDEHYLDDDWSNCYELPAVPQYMGIASDPDGVEYGLHHADQSDIHSEAFSLQGADSLLYTDVPLPVNPNVPMYMGEWERSSPPRGGVPRDSRLSLGDEL
eukprot:6844250-Pyramimonas_sp.AAC.1